MTHKEVERITQSFRWHPTYKRGYKIGKRSWERSAEIELIHEPDMPKEKDSRLALAGYHQAWNDCNRDAVGRVY